MNARKLLVSALSMFMMGTAAFAQLGEKPAAPAAGPFTVKLGETLNGKIVTSPKITAEGVVLERGTKIKVKAVPSKGYSFDSGYQVTSTRFGYGTFKEYMTQEFEVEVGADIMVGASFIESSKLKGHKVISDVVYAKPGVKTLKYDAFIPDGAKNLPGIVIIHGGGWGSNNEDIMRGLARELIKGDRYVVFSIDYRWQNNGDGDDEPNTMTDLIADCYGAILHIQEHAAEYGLDPTKLGVTGDSAGGHLAAAVANDVERVGGNGFGVKPGVYEVLPTYMPKGMTPDKARESLKAIKASAPSYGIFSVAGIRRFFKNLGSDEEAAALAPLDNIPDPAKRAIPTWLNRGSVDGLISDESTVEYFEAMQKAGQEVYYVKVAGA
ncbi:MAG: alpha/beta hydrolase, partial [Bacteroidales bacterium]|nr:alpha/beta hydrolase [Bacteroidales bacterium]